MCCTKYISLIATIGFLLGQHVPLFGQDPVDLFSDQPKLGADHIRLASWNLQHFDLNNGAGPFLPGADESEDFAILVATYAKAIKDLGLDIVAVVEHQRLPGQPERLSSLIQALNGAPTGPWKSDETSIEYDDPTNHFMNLQMCVIWNSEKVQIDPITDRLLEDLRQPRDGAGELVSKRMRMPWLIPVKAGNLEFDLIVLHLKSGGESPQNDEVEALANFIQTRQSASTPRHLIVVGDWNLRPDNSTQRGRLRKMMVPSSGRNLMRVLTVEVLKPSLEGWEELGDFRAENAVADLVPFSHFNNRPEFGTIDTLLDHVAISHTLDEIFDHPIKVSLASGGTDVRPGIEIARPVLRETDYLKLTDHLPVVLTLRTTSGTVVTELVATTLRISSAIPNPLADDVQNEEVEITNSTNAAISLAGWKIVDAAGKSWDLDTMDGSAPAMGTVRIVRRGRAMFLNNTGRETIRLVNAMGTTIDERTYQNASSGEVITFE